LGITLPSGQYAEHTNALERRPILAALIGSIIAEFANVEMVMAVAFATLLQVDTPIGIGILDAITGKTQKRNQIMAVAKAKIKDVDLLARLDKALSNLGHLGDRRDKIAHGKWSTCDFYADKLLWQQNTLGVHGYELYGEKELRELLNRISDGRNALQLMVMEIAKQLGSLPT
jgi:hypothetical protein